MARLYLTAEKILRFILLGTMKEPCMRDFFITWRWNLLSRLWVGNLGKKAATRAAIDAGEVERVTIPPPEIFNR